MYKYNIGVSWMHVSLAQVEWQATVATCGERSLRALHNLAAFQRYKLDYNLYRPRQAHSLGNVIVSFRYFVTDFIYKRAGK